MSRRKRIETVQEARLVDGRAPSPATTFWVTRAVNGGVLCDVVQVWLTPPEHLHVLDDEHWLGTREDGVSSLLDEWSLEHCRKQIGTVPDDWRQVLVSHGRRMVD